MPSSNLPAGTPVVVPPPSPLRCLPRRRNTHAPLPVTPPSQRPPNHGGLFPSTGAAALEVQRLPRPSAGASALWTAAGLVDEENKYFLFLLIANQNPIDHMKIPKYSPTITILPSNSRYFMVFDSVLREIENQVSSNNIVKSAQINGSYYRNILKELMV